MIGSGGGVAPDRLAVEDWVAVTSVDGLVLAEARFD